MKNTSSQYPFDRSWSIYAAAQLACVFEATAPKVGNVHPGASFVDMEYGDFLKSAVAIARVFRRHNELSVGTLVLESVRATRQSVGVNTNLGTLLLMAPLAKAWAQQAMNQVTVNEGTVNQNFQSATEVVLGNLTHLDSKAIYEAIRVAKPGGLGEATQHDVNAEAPVDLVIAMRHAADKDAVAAQYANGFSDLFERLVPWFDEASDSGLDVLSAAANVQIRWLAEELDSLILRKCGAPIAIEVQSLARKVIAADNFDCKAARTRELDDYLRADGHRRNPGTTADLIAATLFVKLLQKPKHQ